RLPYNLSSTRRAVSLLFLRSRTLAPAGVLCALPRGWPRRRLGPGLLILETLDSPTPKYTGMTPNVHAGAPDLSIGPPRKPLHGSAHPGYRRVPAPCKSFRLGALQSDPP